MQLFFPLFSFNTDLCSNNSLFVARHRALNSGSRQNGTCWKKGDVKWLRSKTLELLYWSGLVAEECFSCFYWSLHFLSLQLPPENNATSVL